jgi:hypothetical protein
VDSCIFARWTGTEVTIGCREDILEDIANHCMNTVGIVGKKFDLLPKVKELGLWTGGLGSFVHGFGGWARPWGEPGNPLIAAAWCDEVDKSTLGKLYTNVQEMRQWQFSQGKYPPLHVQNIMRVYNPGAINFMELTDGVMHAVGVGLSNDSGLGRTETMDHREFRLGRRPFFPYFRDATIYIHVDKEKRVETGYSPNADKKRIFTPEEERWLYYANLLQGAKGVFHWGYSNIPDGSGDEDALSFRLGLGGAATGRLWDIRLKKKTVDMLQATWDEIGRLNAEWRAIGPLIAISDVSDRAKVTTANPGDVSASTLIAGLDAMVVVALNHNYDERPLSGEIPSTFHPTQATIDVSLPPWLKPVDVFRVSYKGLTGLKPKMLPGRIMRFDETIKVNDLIVITSKPGMKKWVANKLGQMHRKLKRGAASKAVHVKTPYPY